MIVHRGIDLVLGVVIWGVLVAGCAGADPVSVAPSAPLVRQEVAGINGAPTLADFWDRRAEFVIDVPVTGLPLGESDTLVMANGEMWSYLHASYESAGVVDQCGDPVAFPGCTVIYRSQDRGRSFAPPDPPICQFGCTTCPCTSEGDHIDQQQYPRTSFDHGQFTLVYEYRGRNMVRQSADGLVWGDPVQVPLTGIWQDWYRSCPPAARIGDHPNQTAFYDCLIGSPPGIFVEDNQEGGHIYLFVGMGQNPGNMGCYVGRLGNPIDWLVFCKNNPLFTGAATYGPSDLQGVSANGYFDFRTISSAEVQKIGDRYYMLYEGVRGPTPGDVGDTQFGLGLARSRFDRVDGPWDTFPNNPILLNLPGNVGVGHGDLVVMDGVTYLYTSLDNATRSRLVLTWKGQE